MGARRRCSERAYHGNDVEVFLQTTRTARHAPAALQAGQTASRLASGAPVANRVAARQRQVELLVPVMVARGTYLQMNKRKKKREKSKKEGEYERKKEDGSKGRGMEEK